MRIGFVLGVFAAAVAAVGLLINPLGAAGQEADDPATPQTEQEEQQKLDREAMAERAERMREAFASELGVTVDALDDAFRTVVGAEIEDALAEGLLTDEQAAQVLERLAEAEFKLGAPFGHHGPGHGRARGHFGGPGYGFRGAELPQLSDEVRDEAASAALAEVGDGDVVGVMPGPGDAAYVVVVRGNDGVTIVRLDEQFGVIDTMTGELTPRRGRFGAPFFMPQFQPTPESGSSI